MVWRQGDASDRNRGQGITHEPQAGSYARRVFTEADLKMQRQDLEKRQASEDSKMSKEKKALEEVTKQELRKASSDTPSSSHHKGNLESNIELERRNLELKLKRRKEDLEVRNQALESVTPPESVLQQSPEVVSRFRMLLCEKFAHKQNTAVDDTIKQHDVSLESNESDSDNDEKIVWHSTAKGNKFEVKYYTYPMSEELKEMRINSEDRDLRERGLFEEVTRSGDPGETSNCHGETFLKVPGTIDTKYVETILEDHEFVPTTNPQLGDIVVYRNEEGKITHTGYVYKIEDEKVIFRSKWGPRARYDHPIDAVLSEYGTGVVYHSDTYDRFLKQLPTR